jgi:hypothetical protein
MSNFRDSARVARGLLAALAVSSIAACSDSAGPTTNDPGELAFVRVINAVPDTQAMIYKFVDRLENPLEANGVAFRGASSYQGIQPGQRQFRAFMLNTAGSLVIASGAPILDQAITLRPNTYYTLVHFGRANAAGGNGDTLAVLEDSIPSTATLGNNIAIRVLHYAAGVAGVNVFATRRAGDPLPATPLLSNFAYRANSGSSYPTRVPADSIAARVQVVAAPSIVLAAQGPAGLAGTDQQNPLTGVRTPGAAFTVIAFPAPTATTRGANFPLGAGQTVAIDTLPVVRWFVDGRAANTQPINRN